LYATYFNVRNPLLVLLVEDNAVIFGTEVFTYYFDLYTCLGFVIFLAISIFSLTILMPGGQSVDHCIILACFSIG
jgi:hypothetical protein